MWIPCDASNIYWTDTDGKKYGIKYSFSSTGVTVNKSKTEPAIDSNREYYYEDYYLDRYGSTLESEEELLIDMRKNFEEMVISIEKYGGYYIGRYEVSKNNGEPVEVQGKSVYNWINWYEAYELSKTFGGCNESISTMLIWGCLWDNTLNYLVESGNKTYSEITDAGSWGNYSDSTGNAVTGSGSLRVTGYNEEWKALNIYDLAGNVFEWTQEGYISSSSSAQNSGRIYRGGCWQVSGGANYTTVYYTYYSYNFIRISSDTYNTIIFAQLHNI